MTFILESVVGYLGATLVWVAAIAALAGAGAAAGTGLSDRRLPTRREAAAAGVAALIVVAAAHRLGAPSLDVDLLGRPLLPLWATAAGAATPVLRRLLPVRRRPAEA